MDRQNTLQWLHISDYHAGQKNAKDFWPQIKKRLHEDLRYYFEKNGALDLVVFSGDIAFKGGVEEYQSVKEELIELWAVFAEFEMSPKLFVVPGNHDLERPGSAAPLRNMAQQLRLMADVKNDIFNNPESLYTAELIKAFKNYTDFVKDIKLHIPLVGDIEGKIPGDVSCIVDINGLSVGLVGLNSSWTHLNDTDLNGKLDIYVEQINAVVGGDLPRWAERNHINLLVTHHPASWFNKSALDEFNSDIFVPDLIDAHLFGHMHEGKPEIISTPGGERFNFQVASLFGLEKIKGEVHRKHGFNFVKADANSSTWTVWPRLIEKKAHGWDLGRDHHLLRGDDLSYTTKWKVRKEVVKPVKK